MGWGGEIEHVHSDTIEFTNLTNWQKAKMTIHNPKRVWSVVDAQANLTEVLRLSESEGPQYIEAAGTFVVTPVKPAQDRDEPELTLGQWLVKNAPRGTNLVIPDDEPLELEDENPWADEDNE